MTNPQLCRTVAALADYAREKGLIQPDDHTWAVNRLLETLEEDSFSPPDQPFSAPLADILDALTTHAVEKGLCGDDITSRDLFDTRLMGLLTPRPSLVIGEFRARYRRSPREATGWYYTFSQDTNYIRRDRVAKDRKWLSPTPYGELIITINLSKPEKDPRAIAAAKNAPQSGYPKCLLCRENVGYAGRMNHPARQNHRVIPMTLDGVEWYLQYSPYVYYNEHCIVFNGQHLPMRIDRGTFRRQLEFVSRFPHYFLGSNADLPIVGGSILSHDHFQGGCCTFPMETAPVEREFSFPGYPEIKAGIVRWPMSVVRLTGGDPERLVELAGKVLDAWRGYSDPDAFILAETEGEPHNTITPIARRRGEAYELDLVLRNNITTAEHPLGVYHPHQELHHIKKENIGLIEVMGLAVLPARLEKELAALAGALAEGSDIRAIPELEKHADWAEELRGRYTFTRDNAPGILEQEVGAVFAQVLEHAGVYRRDAQGQAAFLRFLETVK
ncbi:MAG: UDP-glucose--hexose-1-phosphate uridylyltransferase [Angelakisella sp.]|jgi:UDPglucose--hexose-1-phosphate uridylyltransferase|nr:UDP-glucose--hexose-1-phosphate uridylyltransferase [Angelakisella sp.]